jgi:hypothetical protein
MQVQKSTGLYPDHFSRYIELVQDKELNSILNAQATEAESFFNSIPENKWLYKYAEGKWTVKEVLQHITDTERVFSNRAFVFSRKDPNIIQSFDDKEYAKNSNANSKNPKDLIEEFLAVRKSAELLFKGFSQEQLNAIGKGSSYEMDVKAVGYMIAGHYKHHINILKEKYLPGV